MKLVNNSEQFELQFNGTPYNIPQGEFEVVNERLGNHIIFISHKWNKKVDIVPDTSIEQIKQVKVDIPQEIKQKEDLGIPNTVPEGSLPEDDKKDMDNQKLNSELAKQFSGASIETLPKKPGRPKKNV